MTQRVSAQTSDTLAQRYGYRRMPRLAFIVITVAALVFATLGLAWFTLTRPSSSLDTQATSSTVDPATGDVIVGLQVSMPPGSTARCALEARAQDHSNAGWVYVDVPASTEHTQQLAITIHVAKPALAGSLNTCWLTS